MTTMNAFEIRPGHGLVQIDHIVLYRLLLNPGESIAYTHIEAGSLTFWSRVRLSLSFLVLPFAILLTGHSLRVRIQRKKEV